MSTTKAEELAADILSTGEVYDCHHEAAAELRRLAVVEVERDRLRARLDRAVNAAVKHFGEDAIRYKFTLTKSGKVMQEFPRHMDGHWYALQRADDDAHVGLSLRCAEAEAERDDYLQRLNSLHINAKACRDERDRLAAEVEALRADKERLDSGCIMTTERDEFGEQYQCERRGLNLRAAIDAARKEKG